MAVSKKGNNDGFKGKVGNTVRYILNGQWVERSIGEITGPPTQAQEKDWSKTKLLNRMLAPARSFIRIGFELEAKDSTKSAYNLAWSKNKKESVIKGVYPDWEVDFSKASFSSGELPVLEEHEAFELNGGIQFTWDKNMLVPGMKKTDQVMIMVYCPEKKFTFSNLDGAQRKDGQEWVSVPKYRNKMLYHCYISFIASDRQSISESTYVGNLMY